MASASEGACRKFTYRRSSHVPCLTTIGFRVWGLGFRVWGLGFGIWGLGFRVWGLGFRV